MFDEMARVLKQRGVEVCFGHPGGSSLNLMDAFRRHGIRFVLVLHEGTAGIMAGSYSELTGKPVACLVTKSPGVTNLLTGIANAWLERNPVIAISDQHSDGIRSIQTRQVLDQEAMLRPVCKWMGRVTPANTAATVNKAVSHAMADRPGPVYLEIPATVSETRTEIEVTPRVGEAVRGVPTPEDLDRMTSVFRASKRPLIVAGLGVHWAGASESLAAFAQQWGIPIMTTAKAKGILPFGHPLDAGTSIGGILEAKLVDQADHILAVGLDAVELITWRYETTVTSIDTNIDLHDVIRPDFQIIGDIRGILEATSGLVGKSFSWSDGAISVQRQEVRDGLAVATDGLAPHQVVDTVADLAPADAIVTCDAGAHRLLVSQLWPSQQPSSFLTSNGLATMGYSVAAGIGAKMAAPSRPVIVFSGDGGFLMQCQELATAVREGTPVVVIVFDDQAISLIRVKQELKGLPEVGVSLSATDYKALAQGLGADGVNVSDVDELHDAVGSALDSGRTTLIGARIDPSGYPEQFAALRDM